MLYAKTLPEKEAFILAFKKVLDFRSSKIGVGGQVWSMESALVATAPPSSQPLRPLLSAISLLFDIPSIAAD